MEGGEGGGRALVLIAQSFLGNSTDPDSNQQVEVGTETLATLKD